MTFKAVIFTLVGAGLCAVGVFVFLIASDASSTSTERSVQAPLVEVAEVSEVTRFPALTTTGFVRPADALTLTVEVSGRVVEIHKRFEIGAHLEAGTKIIALDPTLYEAEVLRAESALQGARSRVSQAENALSRQQQLAQNDFASEARIEELEATLAGAVAEEGAARASLIVAKDQVADTVVTVPFPFVVLSEQVSFGALVSAGQSLGEVARNDVAEVRTALTERDYRSFRAAGGMMGRVIRVGDADSDMWAEATITAIAPQLDGAARMVDVIATLQDPFRQDVPLLLNSVVDVEIPLPDTGRSVLSLPLDALQTGQRVWRVDEEKRLRAVDFTIERRTETELFILSDALQPGDRVLTTALQIQVEGREVRLTERTDHGEG